MNGSRSNTPRPGAQSYGDRSSLDALNRTIEGLEARIEGLMGTAGRDQRGRVPADGPVAVPDPITEIMQRQRTLTATRERDAIRERDAVRDRDTVRERIQSRAAPRSYEEHSVSQAPAYQPPAFQAPAQPRRELPAAPPLSEQLRSEVYRSEPFRRETVRQENLRPESLRPEPTHQRPEPVRSEPLRSEQYRSEPQRPDPAMAEIAQALVGLRQELKKDIADGLSREMTTLRAEIRGITADAAQDQTMAEDIRGDLQRLSDSINQLGRQASPSQADALKVEFDELRIMIDGLAREDSVHRMEARWTGVEDRMNAFDSNRDDELVALAYRLDEIKSQIGSMNSGPAIHALEDKLISVAQAIEMIGRHMQPDDRHMASQFADLDARLDEISRAIVASGRASGPDSAGVTRVEGRLADLSRQIDSLQRPSDNGVGSRIEALAARVEELANEEAAVRLEERLEQLSQMLERSQKASALPDLTGYLADISRKIDALDQGSVNDALAERLDDLARRIDQLDAPATSDMGDARFDRLEGRLSDIATRLEETQAAPFDDSEILRSLQDQIANLSSLVSQPRDMAPAAVPAEFEGRMSALEDYLATSDEYIIEAARQAAEAVMEAYSKNGVGQSASGGTDMAAISALADDLKVLEDMSRSSEERTARTFEALHETLVHIAEKLERLEERGQEPDAPRVFGTRDVQPQMPRAEQPVFETQDDPFAEADFGRRYEDLKRDMQGFVTEAEPAGPSREEVAEAVAVVTEQAAVHQSDIKTAPLPASKPSLLAGLTKRFTSKRTEPVLAAERQVIDPTPSIDAADAIEPDVANQLLEPGSGVPDVKKILERVRAGQTGRNAPPSETDKADFIAAARRAAQQAAEEVDSMNRGKGGASASPIGGALSRHRRPILMAVGAVLLAIMSYPLVNTLIRGEKAPVEAPVAAIEQKVETPVAADMPATANVAPAIETADTDVEPLSTLQPQSGDQALGETSGDAPQGMPPETTVSETVQPDAKLPDAAAQAMPETGTVNARMLSPVIEGTAPETANDEASTAAAQPATGEAALIVPAEIKPEALAEAARKGDPLALFEVGAVYTEGRGIKADLAQAAKWYQRAADAGVTPAEYRLASLYEKGTGVSRDLTKARTLYQQAAEKGNASAMHNLAVMLASGGGAAPDFAGAGKWFGMAADRGIRDSQFNLAILYARGNGVSQDLEESYKWFSIAARDGDADAGQKRDEVGKALKPDQLKSAKAKFDAWKQTPLDAKANSVDVPDTWVGKGTKTASVDMKKALRNIQAILNNNGFDAGKPDGEMGQKTISAIKAFQKSINQEPTGQITDALVKELLKRNG
ncbi:peptidoglycan-binding protein [Rhizobium sp. Root73]|uniref:SEL1-like repeat protein n=1 Tax=unclassified Rhizobium TaxID=2613769 RepID=UPI000713A85B|nr:MULTISPECIES: SEL1-like repeat protein [unclassified Rhizobium]KQV42020.1 peptidoglycan-binding protein [Rhizobium sp. Root1204]KQY17906.1 peptidoglycan-binding protein [Rhizobium sp. Root1334]KRC13765.1 peptidoglycan-binding protein [Rhizobium sp. Root73]